MDQHDEEIWLVQLHSGATRAMTLDELDAAFNDGTINEDTFVRRDGATKWVRLREELGESDAAPAPAPVYAAPTPVAFASPTPAPVAYQQYNSVRPVVSEIDAGELDLDDAPFARKSNKAKFVVGGLVAAVACAVAAVGAQHIGKSAPAVDLNASVVQAAQPPQVVTPPPPAETATVAKPTLNDDQKKALADKDNQFAQKQDAKKKARANQIVPARGKTQPPPFHKGGNAYDPLNAKL